MSDEQPVNVPSIEPLLPKEVKRIAKRRQKYTNERLKQKAKTSGSGKNQFRNQKHIDLMSFNAEAEFQFVERVRQMIEKEGGMQVAINVVFQEMSYELDISPQTAKRYLIKHSARRAEFRVFGKGVMLNPNYKPEEESEEEDE